ncbi:putative Methyl farnesoate epoxidase [Hypsibius exemplaris]|uniref:Methyl farnesoate epoxidase n=1 Tax=Hypsibius exemplaris TaxID=2072580 RepID=A0A1W0WND5_HYPEX|nr:putative Methyl farnesoate epoxidase [Hypsibius exemplaris]
MFPVAPTAIPHQATEDILLAVYRLPKGTRLIVSLYSIHHDPDLWTDPKVFRPKQFLRDGLIKIPEYWVPFGMDHRSCIGYQLARKELFLIYANMMRNFRLVPEGDSPPSLEFQPG